MPCCDKVKPANLKKHYVHDVHLNELEKETKGIFAWVREQKSAPCEFCKKV